jgi:hypothetical protein
VFVTYGRLEHAQVLSAEWCVPCTLVLGKLVQQEAIRKLDQSKAFGSGVIKVGENRIVIMAVVQQATAPFV